ncbi:MAG: ABC transporter ATP-binding protein [Phycisphaerae bacterium]|nr:ABC transporter ATP-binding protein [Phycisphaerae bacterium]
MGQATVVTSDPAPVVRVSGLWKHYQKQPAVRGIDIEIPPGEIYGLIGPDGAGKSTLMKIIAGVLTHDRGRVEVFGQTVDSERSAERIKGLLGFMPQGLGLNLYPELSIEENIDFFARLRLVPDEELGRRKERLLGVTRLEGFRDRPMKQLSGGMKQKLGLVCTLIHVPRLVILDEPTTGVDPVSRRDFWTILAEFLSEHDMTALVSTAYMDEASRFTELSLFSEGRIIAEGAPEELFDLAPGTMLSLEADDQLGALSRLRRDFEQVEAQASQIRVFLPDTDRERAVRQVQSSLIDFDVVNLWTSEPDLEDVLVALLRRERGDHEPQVEWQPTSADSHSHDLAVRAEGLVRMFGDFRAVDGVSFDIQQGEIFGLLGANGAGKTTVIKMLTGLLKPTAGHGDVAGVDMRRAGREIRERIGYMSQAFSLYLDLTVIENIRLYGGIYGLPRRRVDERIDWIVAMAGLAGYEDRRTSGLPVGVRQRLALGCALVHQPRVLFLDEPTSGVDVMGRRYFWRILLHLARSEGVAILVTTHYMSEAEHCDELALMHAGQIVASGPPASMKEDVENEAGRPLVVVTDDAAEALTALARAGFEGASVYGRSVRLLSRVPERDGKLIEETLGQAGVRMRSVEVQPLSMEDLFVYHVGRLERQAIASGGAR